MGSLLCLAGTIIDVFHFAGDHVTWHDNNIVGTDQKVSAFPLKMLITNTMSIDLIN
jgi:hypothetical protein